MASVIVSRFGGEERERKERNGERVSDVDVDGETGLNNCRNVGEEGDRAFVVERVQGVSRAFGWRQIRTPAATFSECRRNDCFPCSRRSLARHRRTPCIFFSLTDLFSLLFYVFLRLLSSTMLDSSRLHLLFSVLRDQLMRLRLSFARSLFPRSSRSSSSTSARPRQLGFPTKLATRVPWFFNPPAFRGHFSHNGRFRTSTGGILGMLRPETALSLSKHSRSRA
jgi:hypothetical protein